MILSSLLSIFLLFGLAIFYSWLEQSIMARAQQRSGSNRLDSYGAWQLFADWRKHALKERKREGRTPFLAQASRFLPFGYMILFFGVLPYAQAESLGIFTLLAGIGLGLTLTLALVFQAEDTADRFEYKRGLATAFLGWLVLAICFSVAAAHVGSASWQKILDEQRGAPFLLALHDPATFLAAFFSLAASVYASGLYPLADALEYPARGAWARTAYWAQRFWFVALIALWAAVFCGGIQLTWWGVAWLVLRLALVLLLVIWVQMALPRIRASDAAAFAARWLVPASLLTLLLELAWQVVR